MKSHQKSLLSKTPTLILLSAAFMIIFRSFKVFHLELVVLLQEPEHAQVSKGDYASIYPNSLYRSRGLSRREPFLWNIIWGLGRLTILKKKFGANYEQFLRVFFFMFSVAKKQFWIFLKIHIVVFELKLHNISFLKTFFWIYFWIYFGIKKAKYSQTIVSCSTGDTSLHDFYTMTLHIYLPA